MPLTLIHITDPHLLAKPGDTGHGWLVHAAFDAVLEDALAAVPDVDALLLGGDLVDDLSIAGYRWLNARLSALAMPILAVAGNHDCPATMARELTEACVHGRIEIGGWVLIGLDSHCSDSAAGELGAAQRTALQRLLADDPRPSVVCLHHPAWVIGSAWQDTIGLADRDALTATLADTPNARAVVCGHAHQAQTVTLAGSVHGCLTASTMRQFEPGSEGFAEDQIRAPGYRILTLGDNGYVTSQHRRVDSARASYIGATKV